MKVVTAGSKRLAALFCFVFVCLFLCFFFVLFCGNHKVIHSYRLLEYLLFLLYTNFFLWRSAKPLLSYKRTYEQSIQFYTDWAFQCLKLYPYAFVQCLQMIGKWGVFIQYYYFDMIRISNVEYNKINLFFRCPLHIKCYWQIVLFTFYFLNDLKCYFVTMFSKLLLKF